LNYAPAADRNKEAIWAALSGYLPSSQRVLEVASGSGQHALYFMQQNPKMTWQCTELSESRDALQINLNTLSNVEFPKVQSLDVTNATHVTLVSELAPFDCVYSANSLHIMSWSACLAFIQLTSKVLTTDGVCAVYGPFFYADQPVVDSNLAFDAWLKERNPESGVRMFDEVVSAFKEQGLAFVFDHEMPVNNRLLVFRKA
jgi:cyclopropane fatty-acyl-phospholipid synthase-like methyltransferase